MISPQEIFKSQVHPVSSHLYTWTVPKDLAYFEGHFQGHPVLPAIALIDFSLEAVRQNAQAPVELQKISQGKFLKVIEPGAELEIKLEKLALGEWSVVWSENLKSVAQLKLVVS
jgi:3-hydroxymyristoyl/3-hydroxydecanoyl-(acyl carrier protein) dehydratase